LPILFRLLSLKLCALRGTAVESQLSIVMATCAMLRMRGDR
jgi:hypothetical protein